MLPEALEDHARGWRFGRQGPCGQRVLRGNDATEHVMPQRWQTHWPMPDGGSRSSRDTVVDTLGDLASGP